MNPYQPPYQGHGTQPVSRTPLVLAAVGGFVASAYWALLTLFIVLATATGDTSATSLILPLVLIGFYAYDGYRALRGDPRGIRGLLWLHGLGGLVTVSQLARGLDGIALVLYGLKLAIHVFGGITAFLGHRHLTTHGVPGPGL